MQEQRQKDSIKMFMFEKIFIRVAIVVYIAAGAVLLLGNPALFPKFYHPAFMGAMAFVSVFLITLPTVLYTPRTEDQRRLIMRLQSVTALALVLNGLGGLWLFQLYKYGFQYDKFMHALVPFITTITLTKFVHAWYGIPISSALIRIALIVIAGGAIWEVWEFFADFSFNTRTFGVYGKEILRDTIFDLLANTVGIAVGVLYIRKIAN